MKVEIHATAIVSPDAVIGEGTSIGAYSIVGPRVVLGRGNRVGPHAVIEGHTTIGDENQIFQFASVGAVPQDLKYRGEDSTLEIGHRNLIREFSTLQPGTTGGGMVTRIGNGNLFMANTHVGHDGIVGDNNVFANSAALAGHVTVGNRVIVGGLCGIHQFVRLGDFSILGAGSMVAQDIPPFCTAEGNRAKVVGLNAVGLDRGGFSRDDVSRFKSFYRALFVEGGIFREKIARLKTEYSGFEMAERFIAFVESSTRGVASSRKGGEEGSVA